MAQTREGCFNLGVAEAKKGYARPSGGVGSWQKRAFLEGYDSVKQASVGMARTARQEHIHILTEEINSSKIMTANRLLRISYKLQVLKGRENRCVSI
jgi:hypothetical protein